MDQQLPQSTIFATTEGDAWHRRNAAKLAAYSLETDVVARPFLEGALRPRYLFDIGCSTGERLSALCKHLDIGGTGVDASAQAIAVAIARAEPHMSWVARDSVWTLVDYAEAVILSYVLHWFDRSEVQRLLTTSLWQPGCHLIINDFWPSEPINVPYKHCPGVTTYKRRYAEDFEATGQWERVWHQEYEVPALVEGEMEAAACTVLRRKP